MKLVTVTAFGIAMLGAPAFADGHATGDAASGEALFKKCKSCHAIVDEQGEKIVKGGKTGPNLYGIYGRVAGTFDGHKFGDSIVAAGDAGLTWNEADFVNYMADPKKFLAAYLDDSKAKSRMTFKLKKAEDAADVWAYLVSVGPEVTEEDAEPTQSD